MLTGRASCYSKEQLFRQEWTQVLWYLSYKLKGSSDGRMLVLIRRRNKVANTSGNVGHVPQSVSPCSNRHSFDLLTCVWTDGSSSGTSEAEQTGLRLRGPDFSKLNTQ